MHAVCSIVSRDDDKSKHTHTLALADYYERELWQWEWVDATIHFHSLLMIFLIVCRSLSSNSRRSSRARFVFSSFSGYRAQVFRGFGPFSPASTHAFAFCHGYETIKERVRLFEIYATCVRIWHFFFFFKNRKSDRVFSSIVSIWLYFAVRRLSCSVGAVFGGRRNEINCRLRNAWMIAATSCEEGAEQCSPYVWAQSNLHDNDDSLRLSVKW